MNLETKIRKEVEKKKKMTLNKWWNKNGYKVMRVILWPVWLCMIFDEKHKKKVHESLAFTNETCKKYLDKVMPEMVARHNEDHNEILISNANDMGDIQFSHFREYKNKKISRFFRKFSSDVKKYIIEEYTIDGYEKMVLDNWTLWEKAKNKFDWWSTPHNTDYAKGVLFYKEKSEKQEE